MLRNDEESLFWVEIPPLFLFRLLGHVDPHNCYFRKLKFYSKMLERKNENLEHHLNKFFFIRFLSDYLIYRISRVGRVDSRTNVWSGACIGDSSWIRNPLTKVPYSSLIQNLAPKGSQRPTARPNLADI